MEKTKEIKQDKIKENGEKKKPTKTEMIKQLEAEITEEGKGKKLNIMKLLQK